MSFGETIYLSISIFYLIIGFSELVSQLIIDKHYLDINSVYIGAL